MAGASPCAAAPNAAETVLLQPTPLILKDGRIANVSVHVVVFPHGQSSLGSAVQQDLRLMTEEVATDCFLTAQVIGHVGSAEVAENDTLNAHRLARSRADAVQASLIEAGLPAKAIASVWDWQFMVRDARATLWVFRLTPGEDCEGAPLDPATGALVADAQAVESNVAPQTNGAALVGSAAPQRPAEPAPANAAESARPQTNGAALVGSAAAQQPAAPAPANAAGSARPTPAPVVTRPAGPSPASIAMVTPVPSVTQALPAASTTASERPAEARREAAAPAVVAALPERPAPANRPPANQPPAAAEPVQVAAQPSPGGPRPAATGKEERIAIVFPTNSSYFPPGAGRQLRSLLQALGEGGSYEVVLQSSVSGSQEVVGAETAEEAKRYNQWLATRRLERVKDWLDRNAGARSLTIKPDYRANDDSRQVVVRVTPVG